jgi:hypothetical protein
LKGFNQAEIQREKSRLRGDHPFNPLQKSVDSAPLQLVLTTPKPDLRRWEVAKQIKITAGDVSARAELNETETAKAIWEALPIQGQANTWGDEIYFSIPVQLETEKGQATVELGDLGYWEPGTAFCIFFGLTPMSRGDEIRPASPVTVFGRVLDDATVFKKVADGASILVERA